MAIGRVDVNQSERDALVVRGYLVTMLERCAKQAYKLNYSNANT
jgi:hypothetical protein